MDKKIIQPVRLVTLRIIGLKKEIEKAVMKSELPAFMLELVLNEYLSGIRMISQKEYLQDLDEWEKARKKEGEKDGGHQ